MKRALEQLRILGALSESGSLTNPLGKHMAELPVDPMFGKVLLKSKEFGCSEEVLSIISMLSVEADSIFFTPKGKKKEAAEARKKFLSLEGDHVTLLNAYNGFITHKGTWEWCHENFVNLRSLRKARVSTTPN